MKIKKLFLVFNLCLIFPAAFPQKICYNWDNNTVDSLLLHIRNLQSEGDRYFDKGIFPSYRTDAISESITEDDNIFFSEVIVFTLQNIYDELDNHNRRIADKIFQKATSNYFRYRNKEGKITYNFWKKYPSGHFPNSILLKRFKKFILPDDMDVTSLVYLTTDTIETNLMHGLKREMAQHTNLHKLRIENIYERYSNYRAYSTWFGKDMPVEFDVCVLSNVLYLVYRKGMPLNKFDSASLALIREVILNKDHIRHPAYISPSYKRSSVILYHFSRLISGCRPGILLPLKDQLTDEIKAGLLTSGSLMESILLSTALMNLGGCPTELDISRLENDLETFDFFNANSATMLGDPWRKWLIGGDLMSIKFICPAYNYTLLLEYMMLRRRFEG